MEREYSKERIAIPEETRDLLNKDSKTINYEVLTYINDFFKNLKIKILGNHKGNLVDLMVKNDLESWCWETTEAAALFMPDDTIVNRAMLHPSDKDYFFHAFIEFKYNDIEYVFDPCCRMINHKEIYFKLFRPDVKGQTTAKDIKEYFISYVNAYRQIDNQKPEEDTPGTRLIKYIFGDTHDDGIIVKDIDDPNAPMFRSGNVEYKDIVIENDQVTNATAHFKHSGG